MADFSGAGIPQLINEIKMVSDNIATADDAHKKAIAEVGRRVDSYEASLNEIFKKLGRPGAPGHVFDDFERKAAVDYCRLKHQLDVPTNDGSSEYVPPESRVQEAILARKALTAFFRHGNVNKLEPQYQKSLSAFSFGTNEFLLPPTLSSTILSCLVDETDIAGWVNHVQTSSGSIRFLIDNARMQDANWACETNCFSNNPQQELSEGLGTLEIKAEPIRYVACVTSDLLQDAAFNVESWLLDKVSRAFRNTISRAILVGSGNGMPLGLLDPRGGVQVCEVSAETPEGRFNWQDLTMLKWEIPQSWQVGCAYYMNQRTFALLQTMSDSMSRPIFGSLPEGGAGFQFAGSPIRIMSQMPDCLPGSVPVMYGNLKAAYTIVDRQALTVMSDPYSGGWCHLFRFSTRLGGAPACPNAVRLLRIR